MSSVRDNPDKSLPLDHMALYLGFRFLWKNVVLYVEDKGYSGEGERRGGGKWG